MSWYHQKKCKPYFANMLHLLRNLPTQDRLAYASEYIMVLKNLQDS